MVSEEDVPVCAYFLLAMIAPTLIPSKLESGETMVINSPQRIFG